MLRTKELLSAEGLRRLADSSVSQFVFELVYYAFLMAVTVIAYLYTTMYTLIISDRLMDFITIGVLLLAFLKAAADKSWSLWELMAALVLAGGIIWSWNRQARVYMLETAALMVGARRMSFEKILKVYLIALIPVFFFTIAEALIGRIDNLIFTRATGERRISFGSIYPTDFCAHIFYIVCGLAWLREKRITLLEIDLIVALSAFCYYFCDARTTSLCLIALAGVLLYARLRRRAAERRGEEYQMTRAGRTVLCAAAPIAAAGMLFLSAIYNENNGLMYLVNKVLSGRLTYAHAAFGKYGLTLFGQDVYMRGMGGSLTHVGDYFFLDCSYVNIFFRFGLVILAGVLLIMTVGAVRQSRNRSWERLLILTVIALHCAVEHHLLEIAYDPFLLMLLATTSTDRREGSLLQTLRSLRDRCLPPAPAPDTADTE